MYSVVPFSFELHCCTQEERKAATEAIYRGIGSLATGARGPLPLAVKAGVNMSSCFFTFFKYGIVSFTLKQKQSSVACKKYKEMLGPMMEKVKNSFERA